MGTELEWVLEKVSDHEGQSSVGRLWGSKNGEEALFIGVGGRSLNLESRNSSLTMDLHK